MPKADATTLLREDHAKAKKLLDKLVKTNDRASAQRRQLLEALRGELLAHMDVEQQVFYPAFRESVKSREVQRLYYEALEEHHVADMVLSDLARVDPSSPNFAAKAKVLRELVLHHIKEEEREILPKARKHLTKVELRELADRILQRKTELQTGARAVAE